MPERVQLRRTKGWRMPANTRKVDRATRYGNPFPTAAEFRACLERLLDGQPAPTVDRYAANRMATIAHNLRELRGKNLACWCKPGEPCHADVLLEFANAPTPPTP